MRRSRWDHQIFLECLGVEPAYSEDSGAFSYTVTQRGLTLLLTVWELESVIQFSLLQAGEVEPFLTQAVLVRGTAELRKEKWGEFLRLTDCLAIGEFHCLDRDDLFHAAKGLGGVTVEIKVNPQVHIRFV